MEKHCTTELSWGKPISAHNVSLHPCCKTSGSCQLSGLFRMWLMATSFRCMGNKSETHISRTPVKVFWITVLGGGAQRNVSPSVLLSSLSLPTSTYHLCRYLCIFALSIYPSVVCLSIHPTVIYLSLFLFFVVVVQLLSILDGFAQHGLWLHWVLQAPLPWQGCDPWRGSIFLPT